MPTNTCTYFTDRQCRSNGSRLSPGLCQGCGRSVVERDPQVLLTEARAAFLVLTDQIDQFRREQGRSRAYTAARREASSAVALLTSSIETVIANA